MNTVSVNLLVLSCLLGMALTSPVPIDTRLIVPIDSRLIIAEEKIAHLVSVTQTLCKLQISEFKNLGYVNLNVNDPTFEITMKARDEFANTLSLLCLSA